MLNCGMARIVCVYIPYDYYLNALFKRLHQRHYFANKGPSSQGYGFSSGHVWMWELDCEESWVPKNWCFWTVVLEKALESPLDCKEIQPAHYKGEQSWNFFGRNDSKAETPVLWPPHAKTCLVGKDSDAGRDWGQEKGMTEDEMAGWHHQLDGHEFEWTLRVGDGQRGLACCNSWGRKVRHDWVTELNWTDVGTRDQIANIHWIIEKAKEFQKTPTSTSLTTLKPLIVWITTNWQVLKEKGIPDHLTCFLKNL